MRKFEIKNMSIFKYILFIILSAFFLSVIIGYTSTTSNKYMATVLDDTGQKSVDEALIKVTREVNIRVRGDCYPHDGHCRVVIFWLYPAADSVKFSQGTFVARNIHDHSIVYGSTPTGLEDNAVGGKVEVVWLGSITPHKILMPKEFELVMPKLNINGVEKEIPIIRFKHKRVREVLPPLMNY